MLLPGHTQVIATGIELRPHERLHSMYFELGGPIQDMARGMQLLARPTGGIATQRRFMEPRHSPLVFQQMLAAIELWVHTIETAETRATTQRTVFTSQWACILAQCSDIATAVFKLEYVWTSLQRLSTTDFEFQLLATELGAACPRTLETTQCLDLGATMSGTLATRNATADLSRLSLVFHRD